MFWGLNWVVDCYQKYCNLWTMIPGRQLNLLRLIRHRFEEWLLGHKRMTKIDYISVQKAELLRRRTLQSAFVSVFTTAIWSVLWSLVWYVFEGTTRAVCFFLNFSADKTASFDRVVIKISDCRSLQVCPTYVHLSRHLAIIVMTPG